MIKTCVAEYRAGATSVRFPAPRGQPAGVQWQGGRPAGITLDFRPINSLLQDLLQVSPPSVVVQNLLAVSCDL